MSDITRRLVHDQALKLKQEETLKLAAEDKLKEDQQSMLAGFKTNQHKRKMAKARAKAQGAKRLAKLEATATKNEARKRRAL